MLHCDCAHMVKARCYVKLTKRNEHRGLVSDTHLTPGGQSSQDPILGPGVCALHSKGAAPDAHRHRVHTCICVLHMDQEGSSGWSCVEDLV